MKKSDRITAFLGTLAAETDGTLDPCYTGYFACFNAQRYYEAHDVLEHLWLRERDPNHAFFKGLIQVAGAFVHLQKQAARPEHPKDGRRLHPAVRLFRLALANLQAYRPRHLRLDVDALCRLCETLTSTIAASNFHQNPWRPERAPQLRLE